MYIGQNVKKVGKDMSFVGMHITNEGIIAFADSKASLLFEDGRVVEDIKRGKIQKVFKNSNFILVTHGNNEIFSSKDKMNIEDYINNKMTDSMTHEDFINNFYKDVLNNKPEYNDGVYHFIIGTKSNNNQYCIYNINIDIHEDINTEKFPMPQPIYQGFVVGGNQTYINTYQAQSFYHDININEYSSHIKKVVERIIQLENCFNKYKYNSVGLPVNIEIFQ